MKLKSRLESAIVSLILLTATTSLTQAEPQAEPQRKTVVVTDEARRVHQASFVFDGHNDLPWALRTKASASFERMDIAKPQKDLHTDIPRLREGNVGAQFWSVFVPADRAQSGNALLETLQQIELVHAMVKRYPQVFELARTAEDVERIYQSGKIASLIGVEGGHAIENSLGKLRRLHERGAAYMTLTHSDTLAWADSATDDARHGGLSRFGEEVVREMNRLGMLVDLSHVSPETMKDALRVSKAPIIFSHSAARALADHPRNVPDDVLKLTTRNGGVVMVNFFSGFVHPESARRIVDGMRELRKQFPDAQEFRIARARWRVKNPILPGTVHDVVDHIDHIVKLAGIDHVGIGSDYDGVSILPAQLQDVSTYPVITQELLNRKYTPEQIHKIMSGNILRVLAKAQAVSRELNHDGTDLTSLSPGKNEVQIEHDGQTRRLIVTTPKTYSQKNAYPVLFCFHGAGGKAEGQSARWSPQADKKGLIVISAEAVQTLKKWNFKDDFHDQEIDDVGFVSKVVEILIENKIADDKAIFATGHSSGGLFSYRLAKETDVFAAVAPMSCGMAKDAHDPDKNTKPVSILQVIGDKDKSYNGTTNPQVTMYSAKERIEIWRKFNQCGPDPVMVEHGDEIVVYTYVSPSGVEVVFCKVKDQEHHLRRDLRDRADSIAIDFLFKHKRSPKGALGGGLQSGTTELEFQYDGHLRKMLVRLPADYSSEKKYPVVFGFHGAGGPMKAYHRLLEQVVKTHGVISVSPQGISNAAGKTGWNGFANHRISNTDDVGFVVATVDYLEEQASIDRERLYATGGSSGAIFCFRLAMETELFAAIAPMRGAMIKRPPAPKGRPRLSILHVGGGDDPLFLGSGSEDPAEVFYSWQDTMALWAANHGIESPELEEEAISEKVTITRYSPRESTFELLAYLVKDNGHKVERAEMVKAISFMGEFFMRHAKDSSSNSAGSRGP